RSDRKRRPGRSASVARRGDDGRRSSGRGAAVELRLHEGSRAERLRRAHVDLRELMEARLVRTTPALVLLLAVSVPGAGAAGQVAAARPVIEVAWPAPVGHFQPRARDIPVGVYASPEQAEQDAQDRALDEKLKICRGCGI